MQDQDTALALMVLDSDSRAKVRFRSFASVCAGPRRLSVYPSNGHRQRRSAGLFRASNGNQDGERGICCPRTPRERSSSVSSTAGKQRTKKKGAASSIIAGSGTRLSMKRAIRERADNTLRRMESAPHRTNRAVIAQQKISAPASKLCPTVQIALPRAIKRRPANNRKGARTGHLAQVQCAADGRASSLQWSRGLECATSYHSRSVRG